MYLFHIILACIVFQLGESVVVAGLAAAFYLGSLVLESAGVLGRTSVLMANSTTADRGLSLRRHPARDSLSCVRE